MLDIYFGGVVQIKGANRNFSLDVFKTYLFNLTGLEDQSDAESDKTSSKNIKGSQLASLFTPEEELVVFNQNPSGKDILLRAIDQYEKYFKNSVREIKELRRELGELSWTNRELKMAVKQKARQNAFLLNKIE